MNINGRGFPSSYRFAVLPFPPNPSPWLFEDPPRPRAASLQKRSNFAERRRFFDVWAKNLVTTVVVTYFNIGLLLAPHDSVLPIDDSVTYAVDLCLSMLTPDQKRVLGVVWAQFNNTPVALTCSPVIKLVWGLLRGHEERTVFHEMIRSSLKFLKPDYRGEDAIVDYYQIGELDLAALDLDSMVYSILVRSFYFDFNTIMVSHLGALVHQVKPLTSSEATL